MKKLIIVVLILGLCFTACDKAEEILNVKLPAKITEKIPIHVNQTNGAWDNFNNTVVLSIDNGDIHDYINKIKDVKVTKLSYRIIGFSGDAAGEVKASFLVDNIVELNNDFVVKTEADKSTVFVVSNVDQLNELGNALKNNHKITAKYAGSALCDNADMDFMVEVTIELTVTASPI